MKQKYYPSYPSRLLILKKPFHSDKNVDLNAGFLGTLLNHQKVQLLYAGLIFERHAIKDLSLQGVYLEGITGRSLGETSELVLFLNGASSELKLNMAGTVVRQDAHGVGVHFKEIDIDTFCHLKNIVAYNADEPDQVEDELVENISEKSFDE